MPAVTVKGDRPIAGLRGASADDIVSAADWRQDGRAYLGLSVQPPDAGPTITAGASEVDDQGIAILIVRSERPVPLELTGWTLVDEDGRDTAAPPHLPAGDHELQLRRIGYTDTGAAL